MPGNPSAKRFREPADAMDVISPTSGDALGLAEDQAASPPPGGDAAGAATAASDRGAATAATPPADLMT